LIENQEDLFVYGNSTKFNQLLVNILINSVHAVEERGRIKIVSRKCVDAQQSYVSITIEDDGHGMSSDFLKTIFEPFVSTKVKGLGTGLGLSVALSIVSEMDGTIDVTSQPNVGTKFTIILPEYK
jgi:signal transduction histidine kinase